jgi:hypothetical protein
MDVVPISQIKKGVRNAVALWKQKHGLKAQLAP